jgi:hypothetical protein
MDDTSSTVFFNNPDGWYASGNELTLENLGTPTLRRYELVVPDITAHEWRLHRYWDIGSVVSLLLFVLRVFEAADIHVRRC